MTARVSIAEACSLVTDGTHYTPADIGEGYPFLTVKDVSDEGLDFDGCARISEQDFLAADLTKSAPKPGDVLFSKDGTVGKVHVVKTNEPFAVLSSLAILRPKQGVIPGYLGHVLRFPKVLEEALKRKTGSAIRRIVLSDLKQVRIPLPPLAEQRRIAAILDKVDAVRTMRREALVQLDRLAQSIFVEMFGDPAGDNPSFSSVPLVELALGGFQNGAYFPKEAYSQSGIEMVHMSDAFGGLVRRGQLRRVECDEGDVAKYSLEKSDVIIARRSLTYEGAAKPCRVPDSSEPLLFESSFIRIRPDLSKVSTLFLFYYLNNERVREKFVRPFVTQSTISGINQSNLAKVPVLLPPSALQRKFELAVASLEGLLLEHRRSAAGLDQLFVCAQDRAFRGEL